MTMTAAEFLAWDAPDDSERWTLHRRAPDAPWTQRSLDVTLDSIDLTAPLAAFYRTVA
jgi:hypothetical protein